MALILIISQSPFRSTFRDVLIPSLMGNMVSSGLLGIVNRRSLEQSEDSPDLIADRGTDSYETVRICYYWSPSKFWWLAKGLMPYAIGCIDGITGVLHWATCSPMPPRRPLPCKPIPLGFIAEYAAKESSFGCGWFCCYEGDLVLYNISAFYLFIWSTNSYLFIWALSSFATLKSNKSWAVIFKTMGLSLWLEEAGEFCTCESWCCCYGCTRSVWVSPSHWLRTEGIESRYSWSWIKSMLSSKFMSVSGIILLLTLEVKSPWFA